MLGKIGFSLSIECPGLSGFIVRILPKLHAAASTHHSPRNRITRVPARFLAEAGIDQVICVDVRVRQSRSRNPRRRQTAPPRINGGDYRSERGQDLFRLCHGRRFQAQDEGLRDEHILQVGALDPPMNGSADVAGRCHGLTPPISARVGRTGFSALPCRRRGWPDVPAPPCRPASRAGRPGARACARTRPSDGGSRRDPGPGSCRN